MIKYLIIGLSFLCLFNIAAYANPETEQTTKHKEGIGLGLGAIIGGLIGGPPGAIIGAAGGAWFGDKQDKKDSELTALENRLIEKQTELAYLQGEFADMEFTHGMEIQKVKLDNRISALDELSQGVSLTVYFRTNSFKIDSKILPRIERLADYLQAFPEIQLHLEAHADQRGTSEDNQQLSQQRANSVKQALVQAGIQSKRIRNHAHGESKATSSDGDHEGYVFDRRVNINLTLDTEVYALK